MTTDTMSAALPGFTDEFSRGTQTDVTPIDGYDVLGPDGDLTEAQRRCHAFPREQCEAISDCSRCPAYTPPSNRSRA